ncbi:MAG: BatD family protein [Planctomycetota bacterium]
MNRRRVITNLASIACVMASAIAADDISIEAQLSKQTCCLRDNVLLVVKIAGAANPPKPMIPPIEGLTVEYITSNLSERGSSLDPDNLKKPVSFYYKITPQKLGAFKIPPLAFRTDAGDKILTPPLTLSVVQTPKHDVILCEMIANKTDVYLYEAVQVTLKVETKLGEQIRGPEGKAALAIEWLRQIPGFVSVEDIQQHQKMLRDRSAQRRGTAYAVESISRILFPTEAGEKTLPRASIDFECLKPFLPPRTTVIPDPAFGDAFGRGRDSIAWQRLIAESNELKIQVRPLPDQGRPDGFKGAVGQFDMTVTPSGTNVKVGEPITLTSLIRGTGYPATIEAPYPKNSDGFKVYAGDHDTRTGRSTNSIEVTKTFRTVFEPQTTAVKTIPEIVFHYFDPQAEKYVTRTYGPIPIAVSPSDGRPVASVPVTIAASAAPPQPQVMTGDIQPIITDASELRDQSRLIIQEPWFLLATIGPLLLAALCAVIQHHRERLQTDGAFARNTFAMRNAKRRLSAAKAALAAGDAREFHSLLFKTAAEYMGDKLNLPAAAITSQSVSDLLKAGGLDEEIIAETRTCLEACEAGRFAPNTTEADPGMLKRTKALLKRLERAMR